jgi:predicted phage terminase large subunit-like protein
MAEADLDRALALARDLAYNQAEGSLSGFLRHAWPVIEPGTPYLHNWHIDCIAEHLEAVTNGQILRLIVNVPPRSLKSILTTICWPVWSWIHRPQSRWMFTSYSQSLSEFHSVIRRNLIRSDWYQRRWREKYTLAADQDQKREFANSRQGMMIATSVGGTSIGKGGDILVFDDPMNPEEAHSAVQRETANRWICQAFLTRLNNKKDGAIVGIMQRLHEQDTTGMLLEMGGWEHLCLPAEAEQRTVITFPVSLREIVREQGDLLFPDREGPKELAQRKIELGSYGYAGQYQQRPSPEEGGMIKKAWFRYWGYHNLPNSFDEMIQSWDTAMTKDSGDSTSGGIWARKGANVYLLARFKGQWDTPTVIGKMKKATEMFPEALAKLVEKKANGAAIIDLLRDELAGIIPVEPRGSKEARVNAVSPMFEAGNVYVPDPTIEPWVNEYIAELCGFPNMAHDDDVDMTTQALDRLRPAATSAAKEEESKDTPQASAWRTMMEEKQRRDGGGRVSTGWSR